MIGGCWRRRSLQEGQRMKKHSTCLESCCKYCFKLSSYSQIHYILKLYFVSWYLYMGFVFQFQTIEEEFCRVWRWWHKHGSRLWRYPKGRETKVHEYFDHKFHLFVSSIVVYNSCWIVKCSARIAREEDERELQLLEEEERRERLRKNRKLSR